MVHVNRFTRRVGVKVVYCSVVPGGGAWSLRALHGIVPPERRSGDIVSIATRAGRTLFFDFLAVSLGPVGTYDDVYINVYAAPEASYYEAPRKIVMEGADAVVFIADPGRSEAARNREMFRDISAWCREDGRSVPLVVQYHCVDPAGGLLSPAERAALFPAAEEPSFRVERPADVLPPLKEAVKRVFALP